MIGKRNIEALVKSVLESDTDLSSADTFLSISPIFRQKRICKGLKSDTDLTNFSTDLTNFQYGFDKN